jgi:hypothetical protein
MDQVSMQWDGETTGDASVASYGQDEVAIWYSAALLYDYTVQGVLYRNDTVSLTINGTTYTYDLSNLLEITNPSGQTLRMVTGGAIVAGRPYFCRVSQDLSGYAPSSGTNYFRIVLRADWSAQTVRVVLLEASGNSNGGASTASAPPVVTQTWGTTWEISLATVTIDSTPTVTITDTRRFVPEIQTSMLADDAVTSGKIGSGAVDTTELADDAVTDAKLRSSAAVSVIGRSANSAGNPADIAAGSNNQVMMRRSNALTFATINNDNIAANTINTADKCANRSVQRFVPAIGGSGNSSGDLVMNSGGGVPLPDGETAVAFGQWQVPEDLVTTENLVVQAVVVPDGTGDIVVELSANWGAAGEAYSNHNQSTSDTVSLSTGTQREEILTLTISSNLSAGDFVTFRLQRTGGDGSDTLAADVNLAGFSLAYTQDH